MDGNVIGDGAGLPPSNTLYSLAGWWCVHKLVVRSPPSRGPGLQPQFCNQTRFQTPPPRQAHSDTKHAWNTHGTQNNVRKRRDQLEPFRSHYWERKENIWRDRAVELKWFDKDRQTETDLCIELRYAQLIILYAQ